MNCSICGQTIVWQDYEAGEDYISAYLMEEAEKCGPCLVAERRQTEAKEMAAALVANDLAERIALARAQLPPLYVERWEKSAAGWRNRWELMWPQPASPIEVDGFVFVLSTIEHDTGVSAAWLLDGEETNTALDDAFVERRKS